MWSEADRVNICTHVFIKLKIVGHRGTLIGLKASYKKRATRIAGVVCKIVGLFIHQH